MPSTQGTNYTVNCMEDILQIPDMATARKLMNSWGLDMKGIVSKEAALVKLVEYWKSSNGNIAKNKEDVSDGLNDAIKVDNKCRNKLRDKYDEMVDYMKKLPPDYYNDLNEVFPNLKQNIEAHRKDVMSPDCAILIAGERSSGKSTFINLLLQVDLLPTSQLSCTTTFVELRKSGDGRKSAVIHHKIEEGQKRKKSPLLMELQDKKNLDELSKLMQAHEDGESPFEKIEIFWPFRGLEEGFVIVDTPGISDAKHMTKIIERYLTKSFGFIYVLNTANAGGVQRGRLRDFLRMVVNTAEDDFTPSCTIFIGNKFDQVPNSDKQEVMDSTYTRLQMCYPGVRRDQLIFMSLTDAQKNANFGGMSQDHKLLMDSLRRFLPASLRNKLNTHYRYISQILKRSYYSVKVAKTLAAKGIGEKKEQMENLKRQMERLDRDSKYSVEELRKGINFEVENLYKETADFLRSRPFAEHLYRFTERDCAKVDKDWGKIASEAHGRIANRVALAVNTWEKQNNIISTIKEKIVKKFKRDFQLMEDQIKKIEGVLLEGDTRAVADLHKSMKKQAPVRQLWKKAKGNEEEGESVRGLGGAVCSVGKIGNERIIKGIFKTYKTDNACDKMMEASQKFIESILNGNDLKRALEKHLNRFLKGIDTIARMIPEFIRADKQLIEAIKNQMANDKENLVDVFPQLIRHSSILQGQLDMFYIVNIMEQDYRLRDLEWSKSDLLGSGSFADVFQGKLKSNSRDGVVVALKISKEPVKENNVTDTLLEDRTLRELKHKNVIRYFGSVLKEDGGKGQHSKIYWIMIMEFCQDTLKSVILDPEYDNPGKTTASDRNSAMKTIAGFTIQICEGLAYLHSLHLVHRDMKLENILITKDNIVKLTDVGLTRKEVMIAGSIVGSPVYMAPEVLLGEGIYDRKADIYSLAVIMWEMFYGIDAADHISHQLFGTLESSIKQGLRPSLSFSIKPPQTWQDLIVASWDYESKNRPEASAVKAFFEDFIKNQR